MAVLNCNTAVESVGKSKAINRETSAPMTQISRFVGEVVPIARIVTSDRDKSAVPESSKFADCARFSHHLRI